MNILKKYIIAIIAIMATSACTSSSEPALKPMPEGGGENNPNKPVETISIPINLSLEENNTRAMRYSGTKVRFPEYHLMFKVATRIGDKIATQSLVFQYKPEDRSHSYKGYIKVPSDAVSKDNKIADNIEIAAVLMEAYHYQRDVYYVPKPKDAPEPYPYTEPTLPPEPAPDPIEDEISYGLFGSPAIYYPSDLPEYLRPDPNNFLETLPDMNNSNSSEDLSSTFPVYKYAKLYKEDQYKIQILHPEKAVKGTEDDVTLTLSSFSEWSKLELVNIEGKLSFKNKTLNFRSAGTLVAIDIVTPQELEESYKITDIIVVSNKLSRSWTFDFRGNTMESSIKNNESYKSPYLHYEIKESKDKGLYLEAGNKEGGKYSTYYIWFAPDSNPAERDKISGAIGDTPYFNNEPKLDSDKYFAQIGYRALYEESKLDRPDPGSQTGTEYYWKLRNRILTNSIKNDVKLSSRVKLTINIPKKLPRPTIIEMGSLYWLDL